jgi:demethylmenaquinone methyltransferase/2-methoxy-6-polyprenyl-1,4-benzoquinol methylase
MAAEKLNLSDKTFDFVVTTFVWCSVPDPIKGMKEARRVLKPDGQAIFVEHVLSNKKIVALWQKIINPFDRCVFGFNVNRDTRYNLHLAGFNIIEDKNLALWDVFRLFKATRY